MAVPNLPRRTIRTLKRLADQADAGRQGGGNIPNPDARDVVYVVRIDDPIPAASDSLPGSGVVPLYKFDSEDALVDVLNAANEPVERTVYNLSEAPSATGYALAMQETPTGRLILAASGGGAAGNPGEFPPGVDSCRCDLCPEGVPLPGDPTVCCESSLVFVGEVWPPGVVHEFKYAPDDKWATDPAGFDDPDTCENEEDPPETVANKYRLVRIPSHTLGEDRVELQLVEDNGCPVRCFVYKATKHLKCPCAQEFELVSWNNIGRDELPCKICLNPREPIEDLEFDTSLAPVGCSWHDCVDDADPGDTIDLANQMALLVGGFEGFGCQGFGEDFAFRFTRDNPCVPGKSCSYLYDADINGLWLMNRGGGGSWPIPSGGTRPLSWRLGRELEAGESLCEEWWTSRLVGHRAAGDCEPTVNITSVGRVGLFRSGCNYWLEAYVGVPTSGSGSPVVVWTSAVETFGAGDELQDVVDWFTVNHALTLLESPAHVGGVLCECSADGYGVTTGNAQVMTTATLLDGDDAGTQPATNSGECGTPCTTPTADPDPDPETTCCINDECFEDMDGTDCAAAGGTIMSDCEECESKVPCCQPTGHCALMTPAACAAVGGTPLAGDACPPGDCREGACCNGTSCTVTIQASCSGTWQGPDTVCSPNPCAATGACCASGGECSIRTQAICEGIGGNWLGPSTTCVGVDCSRGACCSKDDSGHSCDCGEDYTEFECANPSAGLPGDFKPGMTCAEATSAAGPCGDFGVGDCAFSPP